MSHGPHQGGVIVLAVLAAFTLSACQKASTENQLLSDSGMTMEDPVFHPSDDYLRLGKVYFRNGDYGLAEWNFRKAVETSPKDTEAWLGLAASYDQLRRFDLADRAYDEVLRQAGNNAVVLNNVGYSYLLRGNVKKARGLLLKAYELDPQNPSIANNLKLLNESSNVVKRAEL